MKLSIILYGLYQMLKRTARRHPSFKKRLEEYNFTAQIRVMSKSKGRYFTFRNGRILSKSGLHSSPDVCISYSSTCLTGVSLGAALGYLRHQLVGLRRSFAMIVT